MIKLSEIHFEIKQALNGKIHIDKLVNLINNQKFIMSKESYNVLSESYVNKHETSFSFFSSGEIIDLVKNHTDYEKYKNLVNDKNYFFAFVNEEKALKDKVELLNKNYQFLGKYHTHPYTQEIRDEVKREHNLRFEKNSKIIKSKDHFPSSGDIDSWSYNNQPDEFIFIGSKNSSPKLSISTYIPIGTFNSIGNENINSEEFEKGLFALKTPIEDQEDFSLVNMNKTEADKYKHILKPILTISYKNQRNFPFQNVETYFIEIPLLIK